MLNNLDVVYRLKAWAIYRKKGEYFISGDEQPKQLGKSYQSLRHACTAIARKLEEEFATRDARYGKR